jgi:hypothetical protein
MRIIRRKPNVRVIIKRPNWKNESRLEEFTIVTFEPRPCSMEEKSKALGKWETPKNYNAKSDGLLSYSFSESCRSVDTPFTLSLTPEQDKNGLTWVDKIDELDLVYIEEDDYIRYCGLVHQVRYSARMSGNGPNRSIVVAGNSFGELLKEFRLVLDVAQFINVPASEQNTKAASEFLAKKDTSLKAAMDFYYDNFMEIISKMSNKSSVMGKLIEAKVDRSRLAADAHTIIPMSQSMYQTGVNTIWDMWRKIVPNPLFELFGKWDPTVGERGIGKYTIIARQCPFEPNDWKKLIKFPVDPIVVTDYSVGYDDSEVSTYFYATASSLGITNNMALIVDNYKNVYEIDKDKWKKYGYRPLNVELSFLKRDETDSSSIDGSLSKISKMLSRWYAKNDEFLSGSISMESWDKVGVSDYYSVGNRVEFLGGEFYLTDVQRKWAYGGPLTVEVKMTRGYQYEGNGKYQSPIKNVGKRFKEIEENK